MKSLNFVIIWSIIFLLFGFYINIEINKFTDKFTDEISIVEDYITDENWEDASEKLKSFSKLWHEEKSLWYKLLNHEYFDSICLRITILDKCIYTKNKTNSFEQIEIIKMTLDNILESEKCDINHIL